MRNVEGLLMKKIDIGTANYRFDLLTVAFLALAPILRLALVTGPVGSDDLGYFHAATQLAGLHRLPEVNHEMGRLWFLLLVGLPAVIGGSIRIGAITSVLILSVRDVVVTVFVRRQLGQMPASGCAGVLALNGLSATYGGLMLPDPLLGLAMFASAAYVFNAQGKAATKRFASICIGGAIAAIAYSVKETGILIIPPAVVWIAIAVGDTVQEKVRLIIGFLCAFGAFALIEVMVFYLLTGDPLYRLHSLSVEHNAIMGEAKNLHQFMQHVYWNFRGAIDPWAVSTPVLVTAACVWFYCAITRTRFIFFVLVGAFIAVYLIFGSSSLVRLIPLPEQDRYFEPVVPFLAVTVGAAISAMASKWGVRSATVLSVGTPILLALASIPSVVANAGDIGFSTLGKNTAIALNAISHTHPERPIYVSPTLHRTIEPFVDSAIFSRLRIVPGEGPLPTGFFLLRSRNDPASSDPHLHAIEDLPISLIIDEDQRTFARLASRWNAPAQGWRAIVHENLPSPAPTN